MLEYCSFSNLQTLIPDHQCDWSGTTLIFNISMPLCLADVEFFFLQLHQQHSSHQDTSHSYLVCSEKVREKRLGEEVKSSL